ncbi:hypothetical protein DIPPA_18044 [Diplonema papillatum]|nr:hypothetical protein DIPPA_18044 [Diplonema papillatum]
MRKGRSRSTAVLEVAKALLVAVVVSTIILIHVSHQSMLSRSRVTHADRMQRQTRSRNDNANNFNHKNNNNNNNNNIINAGVVDSRDDAVLPDNWVRPSVKPQRHTSSLSSEAQQAAQRQSGRAGEEGGEDASHVADPKHPEQPQQQQQQLQQQQQEQMNEQQQQQLNEQQQQQQPPSGSAGEISGTGAVARKQVLPVPGANGFRRCAVRNENALRMTRSGQRCVFPFRHGRARHTDVTTDGRCAVHVGRTGIARVLHAVDQRQTMSVDQTCEGVEEAKTCNGDPIPDATCSTLVETAACLCRGSSGKTKYHIRCKRLSCDVACKEQAEDYMSASHAKSQQAGSGGVDIIETLASLSLKLPPTKDTLTQYKEFAKSLPPLSDVSDQWCGKGIVIMAGSSGTLPQAIATVSFLREHFHSNVPVEIWRTGDEETHMEEVFTDGIERLGIILRTLPKHAESKTTTEMFALKPAVILASSFDVVLFLDADALPIVDPLEVFQQRGDISGLFWPDYWTLLHDAAIWEALGDWPFPSKIAPSQDSGLMVVCKTCGGYKPLAVAFYFNYHNTVYYPAIYQGHFAERQCRGNKCNHGHTVPGVGDKDTFQLAWYALRERFHMMPPSGLAGNMLPKRGLVCGTSFLHKSRNGAALAVHHNSNKWWWRDFAEGRWVGQMQALHLKHQSSYASDDQAFHADGANKAPCGSSSMIWWRLDANAKNRHPLSHDCHHPWSVDADCPLLRMSDVVSWKRRNYKHSVVATTRVV